MATYGDPPLEGWKLSDSGILTIPTTTATSTHTITTTNHTIPVVADPNIQPGQIVYTNDGRTYAWQVQQTNTPWQPPYVPPVDQVEYDQPEYKQPVVPLFADAVTVKAALQRQLLVLESLQEDGLVGPLAEWLADAIFFLNETMEALERISGA